MKARNFRYIRPTSVDQAYRILAENDGDAVPLAGGQSLLATLNMRLSAPKLLVDVGDLKELAGQSYADGTVRLGALTLHRELLASELVKKHVPLLARVTVETADPMTTSQVVAPRFPAPLGVVRTRSPACETFRWMKTQIPPYRANHTSLV